MYLLNFFLIFFYVVNNHGKSIYYIVSLLVLKGFDTIIMQIEVDQYASFPLNAKSGNTLIIKRFCIWKPKGHNVQFSENFTP